MEPVELREFPASYVFIGLFERPGAKPAAAHTGVSVVDSGKTP